MVFLLDSTLLVHLVTNKKACKSLIYKPFRFCALYRERVLCSTNRVKQNTSKVKDFQSTIVFTLSFAFS